MSYCRWSSDNFGCDVYAYESCDGGYVVHVAARRVVGEVPKLPPLGGDMEKFAEAHARQMAFLETAEREPIGLPMDGKTITCETAKCLADALLTLRSIGYRVPDYAIESLQEEALDE